MLDITQIGIGAIVGLIIGPIIILMLSLMIYGLRGKKIEKEMNKLREDHKHELKRIKKRYDRVNKKFMKKRDLLVKLTDRKPVVLEE